MARIENAKPRSSSGGYERLFGIAELAYLTTCIQSTVISAGSELERIIKGKALVIKDLDAFLTQHKMSDGVFIASKRLVKTCKTLNSSVSEPDFLIFKRSKGNNHCYVVELKDGDAFDTKKSSGEYDNIRKFIEKCSPLISYTMSGHFCCFNQNNREEIVKGFKGKITEDAAMTGREFCNLLEIDYDKIVESRKSDQPATVKYFLSELIKIDKVRAILRDMLQKYDDSDNPGNQR